MNDIIRTVDVGGNGSRRADVRGKEVLNYVATRKGEINDVAALFEFATSGMTSAHVGVAYVAAGDIRADGVMVKASNIPWLNGVNLVNGTKAICKTNVIAINDMDGAVAGMARLVGNPSYFMGITWSSGIGKRVWKDGKILASCEGGHVCVDRSPFAMLCGCGLRGCVESICGGEAIRRRVLAETEVRGIKIPDGVSPCRFLDERYVDEEQWAIDIYGMIALAMGEYLATLQTLFRVPLVVWKGTFALNALPLIQSQIGCHMRQRLMNPDWEGDMEFTMSPEPENDALIGAAALFEQA